MHASDTMRVYMNQAPVCRVETLMEKTEQPRTRKEHMTVSRLKTIAHLSPITKNKLLTYYKNCSPMTKHAHLSQKKTHVVQKWLTYDKNCGPVPVAIALSNEVRPVLHNPVSQSTSKRQLLLLVGGVEDKGARQRLKHVDHLVRWNALSLRQR